MLPLLAAPALRCSIKVLACRILTCCASCCSSQSGPCPPERAGPAPIPRLWGQPESAGKGDFWAALEANLAQCSLYQVDLALIPPSLNLHGLTHVTECPVSIWQQLLQGAAPHTRCCRRQLLLMLVHLGMLHCPVMHSVMRCQMHSIWGYTAAWHPATSGAGRSRSPAEGAGADGAPESG